MTSLSCVVAVQTDPNEEHVDIMTELPLHLLLPRQATFSPLRSGTFITTALLPEIRKRKQKKLKYLRVFGRDVVRWDRRDASIPLHGN